jgi:hypothetical protein
MALADLFRSRMLTETVQRLRIEHSAVNLVRGADDNSTFWIGQPIATTPNGLLIPPMAYGVPRPGFQRTSDETTLGLEMTPECGNWRGTP